MGTPSDTAVRILTGAAIAIVLTENRECHFILGLRSEPSPKFEVNPRQVRPFRKAVFFANDDDDDDDVSTRKRGSSAVSPIHIYQHNNLLQLDA